MKRLLFSILSVITLASCQDDYNYESYPVVEGWIEAGAPPVVMLTRSVPLDVDWLEPDSLANFVLRYARVSVECEDEEVVLTARYDKRYFPPYIYTTGRMLGEEGKTYTLRVDDRLFSAEAVTTIPQRPHIDTCYRAAQGEASPLYLSFRSTSAADCYCISACEPDGRQYTLVEGGCLSGTDLREYNTVEVRPRTTLVNNVEADTLNVRLARVDSTAYEAIKAFAEAATLQNLFFANGLKRAEGNVNGAFGYWAGLASDYAKQK